MPKDVGGCAKLLDAVAFGALVRAKRGAKRLTQANLAVDAFGDETRKGDISRIESGKVTPQEATIQKLMVHLDISEAEMAPIRMSRPSAKQLEDIPALSRDELQILASRFNHPEAYDANDAVLRDFLRNKAEEYRGYKATIDRLDDRVAAIANLKGAAQHAAETLNFDEVEALLSRVDEVETEIAAETKVARAKNALLRNDPDHAFQILSAAADSFASVEALAPSAKRAEYEDLLYQHGLRYAGPAFALTVQMNRDAISAVPRGANASLWAYLQNNLGIALRGLANRTGEPQTVRDAIDGFNAALEVRTREASEMQWATTQMNLGIALADLGALTGDLQPLRDAIDAYNAALEVYTRQASVMQWATTQMNLGNALTNLAPRTGDPQNLRDAIDAYNAALEVRTREAGEMQWAMTQMNLGTALADLGTLTGDPQPLRDAIDAYNAALEVRTREASKMEWAMTQMNLGAGQGNLAKLLPSDEARAALNDGMRSADNALEVFTPETAAAYHEIATANRAEILAALDALGPQDG